MSMYYMPTHFVELGNQVKKMDPKVVPALKTCVISILTRH